MTLILFNGFQLGLKALSRIPESISFEPPSFSHFGGGLGGGNILFGGLIGGNLSSLCFIVFITYLLLSIVLFLIFLFGWVAPSFLLFGFCRSLIDKETTEVCLSQL